MPKACCTVSHISCGFAKKASNSTVLRSRKLRANNIRNPRYTLRTVDFTTAKTKTPFAHRTLSFILLLSRQIVHPFYSHCTGIILSIPFLSESPLLFSLFPIGKSEKRHQWIVKTNRFFQNGHIVMEMRKTNIDHPSPLFNPQARTGKRETAYSCVKETLLPGVNYFFIRGCFHGNHLGFATLTDSLSSIAGDTRVAGDLSIQKTPVTTGVPEKKITRPNAFLSVFSSARTDTRCLALFLRLGLSLVCVPDTLHPIPKQAKPIHLF